METANRKFWSLKYTIERRNNIYFQKSHFTDIELAELDRKGEIDIDGVVFSKVVLKEKGKKTRFIPKFEIFNTEEPTYTIVFKRERKNSKKGFFIILPISEIDVGQKNFKRDIVREPLIRKKYKKKTLKYRKLCHIFEFESIENNGKQVRELIENYFANFMDLKHKQGILWGLVTIKSHFYDKTGDLIVNPDKKPTDDDVLIFDGYFRSKIQNNLYDIWFTLDGMLEYYYDKIRLNQKPKNQRRYLMVSDYETIYVQLCLFKQYSLTFL